MTTDEKEKIFYVSAITVLAITLFTITYFRGDFPM